MNFVKKMLVIVSLLAVSAVEFGCGEKETSVPSVKLTASTITSQADASAHTHVVTIPFTDITASPAADIYQYRSEVTSGHSHVIALSKQEVIDINNGLRMVLVSSVPNAGTSHTHTWIIQGGDVLYEKNCFNCHTNDKRGHTPMNVSFNASQTGAVINPAAAPLSTSTAAVPDPNYVPAAISLDGVSLYAVNCAICHGALATSTKLNKSFALIKGAISNNTGGMASLGALTDAQLQAIATALIK